MVCAVACVNIFLANNTSSLVDNSLNLDDVEMFASAQDLTEPGGGGGGGGNPNNPTVWKCMYCDNLRYYDYSGSPIWNPFNSHCDCITVSDFHFQCVYSNYSSGVNECVYGSKKTETGSSWNYGCESGGVSFGLDG